MMETEWIKRLRSRPGSELLGDDAALFDGSVLTVDMLTEGVDFLLAETDATLIGRKALAVNLSDLAAMGAVPTGFLVAVALPDVMPKSGNVELAEQLYAGMEPLIDKYHLTLIGGDTNTWNGGLVLSVTALGKATPNGLLRRSGGKPGDRILVTGKLGGSILRHQFLFEPRINEALYLNEHYEIHAAMDISDGFSLDLHRLAVESKLGAVIFESAIPITGDAFELSSQTGRPPLEHALSDGEDFELILAVSSEEADKLLKLQPLQIPFGVTLYEAAELTDAPGLRILNANGNVRDLTPQGFLH
jgi:thiamine-monophosphate kinase